MCWLTSPQPKAVMDRNNDPTIGGDIASIIIERGKKAVLF
jgi:hypothetical protein